MELADVVESHDELAEQMRPRGEQGNLEGDPLAFNPNLLRERVSRLGNVWVEHLFYVAQNYVLSRALLLLRVGVEVRHSDLALALEP